LSGDDGWVGMCASACETTAPHWSKVNRDKLKVYRLARIGRKRRGLHSLGHSIASSSMSHPAQKFLVRVDLHHECCSKIFFCQ
jgi:hypothetical protein